METYRRLWPYAARYLKWTILAVFCTMVVSSTSGLTAWLVKPVLEGIFIKKNGSLLVLLSFAIMLVYLAKGLFTYLQSFIIQRTTLYIIRDIRNDLYSHMMYLPLDEYQKNPTGKLISHMMNDVGQLSRLMANVIKDSLQQSFTIAGLITVAFIRNWRLALVAVVLFPVAGFFISKYGKRMRRISRKAQQNIAVLVSILHETFTGIKIVKAFTTEEKEKQKFIDQNRENTKINVKAAGVSSLVSPTMEAIGGAALAIIIFYGGGSVISGQMSTGDFFSFTVALGLMYGPVKALGNIHNSMQQALAASERIFDVLDKATERAAMDNGRPGPEGVKEAIEYKDVWFRYRGEEEDVLKGVNLEIKKGEVVAFVGSSGGGKTTLVNLLPRFYEFEKGSITVDGTDIREFGLKALRQQVAVVTQDTILFNDTVENNLTYGSGACPVEKIIAAAKAAHADTFIDKLPEKYNTVIGEKGVRLSGGEKQRLSIARAILKGSPILILDEATSALDTESERIVQKALENLMKNRTTLVIAHRLSTIINADKIVVMAGGRITDIGKHAELLEKSELYRKLYRMQFGSVESRHAEAIG